MKVYIGSDHRGFALKQRIVDYLDKQSIDCIDMGAHLLDPQDDDFDFASLVCQKISRGDVGILLCGSGHGMDLVANRYRHVRCIVGFNLPVVIQAREHLDANVLALPAEWITYELAIEMINAFFDTPFSAQDKYVRRLNKLQNIQ